MNKQERDNETNDLLGKLVAKRINAKQSSYEYKKALKTTQKSFKRYHGLEVDPKQVEFEYERLYDKLICHAYTFKMKKIKKLYEKTLRTCLDTLPSEDYLKAYEILYFLVECHGSMFDSNDYDDLNETTQELIVDIEDEDWKFILTESEDIKSLVRNDYYETDSDEDNDINSMVSFPVQSNLNNYSVFDREFNDQFRPSRIEYKDWNVDELIENCYKNLQHEYWIPSNHTLRTELRDNESDLLFSRFESHLKLTNNNKFISGNKNRDIELTEYQFIREIIDVLQGSRKSCILDVKFHELNINGNYFKLKRNLKLLNLSWLLIDVILEKFCELASNTLRLTLIVEYVLFLPKNRSSIPEPIVSLIHEVSRYLDDFRKTLCDFERKTKSEHITILSFLDQLLNKWFDRIKLLMDLFICVTYSKFDSLHVNSTVINVLNLLYAVLNDHIVGCCTDLWQVKCTSDLFHATFHPYLQALDYHLSGQLVHLTNQESFLINSRQQFGDIRLNLEQYWYHGFSILKTDGDILSCIPNLFKPCLIVLISTIKSLDLLQILSVEMTCPDLLNPVITEPGSIMGLEFWDKTNEVVSVPMKINQKKPKIEQMNDNVLMKRICDDLENGFDDEIVLKMESKLDELLVDCKKEDLVKSVMGIQEKVGKFIYQRHSVVLKHLIQVYYDKLQLGDYLNCIKSIYFQMAGLEMYEIRQHLFELMCNVDGRLDSKYLNNSMNEFVRQVLSESQHSYLKSHADRFQLYFVDAEGDSVHYLLNVLERLEIHYRRGWPIKLVLPDKIIDQSNACMRFLMKLKFAKYCLDDRMFSRTRKEVYPRTHESRQLMRRLCGQRLKILQIINTLNTYIMNSFIIPSWCEIERDYRDDLGGVKEKDVVVNDFNDFLVHIQQPFETMTRSCLQAPDLIKIGRCFDEIIVVAVETARFEYKSEGNSDLKILEDKYRQSVDFVANLLKGLEQYGVDMDGLDLTAFR